MSRKTWSARGTALGTGGTGEVALDGPGMAGALRVQVTLAIFSDGTVAGDPSEVARVQAVSTALEEDLSAWRGILTATLGKPQEPAIEWLRAAGDRRRAERPTDPSGLRRLVDVWLREPRGPGFISSVVESELKNIEMRLVPVTPVARAAKEARATRPVTELVQAIATTGLAREFVVSVQNQRTVPLESWAAILTDATSGRPLRAIARDAGADLPQEAASTIPALGLLEIGRYRPESDLAGGVRVHLEFAMWQDLQWQGFALNQQRTLTSRELRADEYDFFIGPIREAAALPVSEALAALTARQQEFRRGTLGRQSSGLQAQLDIWTRLAVTAPQRLPELLLAHATAIETHRAVLRRHRQTQR